MVKPEHLMAHLRANGFPIFPYSVNRITAEKDRHLLITQIPGLQGGGVEGLIDQPGFQFRTRAPKDNPAQAEEDLELLDRIMLNEALWPFRAGNHHVLSIFRQGGPPIYLTTDHQNRVSHICNYGLDASRLAAY